MGRLKKGPLMFFSGGLSRQNENDDLQLPSHSYPLCLTSKIFSTFCDICSIHRGM